jgi:hypothetical protein
VKAKALLAHPVTRRTRTIVRRVAITLSVVTAVVFVTIVTVDWGPVLMDWGPTLTDGGVEGVASRRLGGRPMHIGKMSLRLWDGKFIFDDVLIEGLTPEARPFFTAKRISLSMTWGPLVNKRVVVDDVALTDWRMLVEQMPDNGPISFPRINSQEPREPNWFTRGWTTTVPWVRAHRGEFVYEDHGMPWSIVAPNIDITIARPGTEYLGTATFTKGTVRIQSWEPFAADMRSTFKIDQGRILLNRIDLKTDGARTILRGDVNMRHWPEQMYQMRSTIDFPTMREIFFARDTFSLSGTGQFDGTFHLFRDGPPGARMGRELKGVIASPLAGVNAHRFEDFRGDVRWTPHLLEVSNASAGVYGGATRFDYRMAPLGRKDVRPTYTFDAELEDVDLTRYSDFLELDGLRLAGRMSGRNLLEWPSGRWPQRRGSGEMTIAAPDGVETQTRRMPIERITARDAAGERLGPFSAHTPLQPVPLAGSLRYAFDPDWIDFNPSTVSTPDTYVEFAGRTAWNRTMSRLPFHVTSSDWQESDRLFAGFLTALGSPTPAIPVGGHGTFDGVVLNDLRHPRIEGTFDSERMRAFNVLWGTTKGSAVIENNYADVKDAVVTSGDATIRADGRFSVGSPRRDGGEEINAVIRIDRRPVVDLRRAFGIEDYDFDGTLSGEFHVYGNYLTPFGFGTMRIVDGVAYGQPFQTSEASVRLEGNGVRLDRIGMASGGGRGTGAAFIGWNGTYSFNFDARGIGIDSIPLVTGAPLPLSGLIDVTAGGSGTFEVPRYDVRGTLRDFFIADEGIGQVNGTLGIDGDLMTIAMEAASPRLAISAAGRIALTPEMDAELSFSVADTSLDPYLRLIWPALSPYTTAVASGSVRVVGELANREHLLVDATVDRVDARLFDYAIRNASPIRAALDRNAIRVNAMRLVGQDTQLDVSGSLTLADERIDMRATGDANLGLLQGFFPNIRSTGRAALAATFAGPMRDPEVGGTLTIDNGRIRHFALPHALESIRGAARFDSRGMSLDGLSAELGNGAVQFGGRLDKSGYRLGRLDVTMVGTGMRLRFPEGMRSLVDASLALQGTPEAAVLTGLVTVRDAEYRQPFNAGGGLFDFAGGGATPVSSSLQPTLPLRYDVRINAPSTLHVRNNLAVLDASANLQLQGTFDRPLLFGRAEVERGEVTFEGRRYVVTRGAIDFNNPVRIDPFVDVEAETRVRVPGETYRVIARATGTMERFTTFSFDSDPPLPQVEVMALVFSDVSPGQNAELRRFGAITPQEQLLRDRAARALTGTVTSGVDRVAQQTFGVDTFQITPSLNDPNQQSSRLTPGARLTIGKRLSDRAYLTYSRSLSTTTRDQIILLEYDQTDRFSWIVSRNEDGTYAVDVRVRRAF